MVEKVETSCGTQYLFSFECYEEERQEQRRREEEKRESWKHLPTFNAPKNDNQKLFNLQYEYYNGNEKALSKIFEELLKIAPKLINIESRKRKLILPQEKIDNMALDAAAIFVEQIKRNELIITTSFIAYLRFQVLKVLFYETEGEMFEKWLMTNRVDMIYEDQATIHSLKRVFQHEVFGRVFDEETLKPGELFQAELFSESNWRGNAQQA